MGPRYGIAFYFGILIEDEALLKILKKIYLPFDKRIISFRFDPIIASNVDDWYTEILQKHKFSETDLQLMVPSEWFFEMFSLVRTQSLCQLRSSVHSPQSPVHSPQSKVCSLQNSSVCRLKTAD